GSGGCGRAGAAPGAGGPNGRMSAVKSDPAGADGALTGCGGTGTGRDRGGQPAQEAVIPDGDLPPVRGNVSRLSSLRRARRMQAGAAAVMLAVALAGCGSTAKSRYVSQLNKMCEDFARRQHEITADNDL